MNYRRQPRQIDGGYERFGPHVEIGDVKVELQDIEPIRSLVALSLFEAFRRYNKNGVTTQTYFDETHDNTKGGRRIEGYGPYNVEDEQSTYIGAVLRHDMHDTWRLVMMQSSLNQADRGSKKVIRHFFEVVGGNVLIAKKQARIARSTTAIEVDIEGITETTVSSRKMYEKAISVDDAVRLRESLGRTVRYLESQA